MGKGSRLSFLFSSASHTGSRKPPCDLHQDACAVTVRETYACTGAALPFSPPHPLCLPAPDTPTVRSRTDSGAWALYRPPELGPHLRNTPGSRTGSGEDGGCEYIQMEHGPAMERRKCYHLCVTRWVDLERMVPSEMSQTEKDKNHDSLQMWDTKQKATNEQNKQKQTHRHRHQNGGHQTGWEGGERKSVRCGVTEVD